MTTKAYKEYSADELSFLTQGVMTYLDTWELTNEQIVIVLGLQDEIKIRKLQAYRNGSDVFPDISQLIPRVDHIIGIADANKKTPLDIMLDPQSANGLLKVRMEVDCNYAYAISEAMRDQQQS